MNKASRLNFALVLLGLSIGLSQSRSQLDGYLTAQARRYQQNNLIHPAAQELFNRVYDHLYQGRSQFVRVRLEAGRTYWITAACDDDCDDLDLTLFDENNNLIDADTAPDDEPLVRVTPIRTAQFRYRVDMVSCKVEPCAYVAGIWVR
ncbi:hypothetical protein DV704_02005 [Meiothermus sp. QL-1]|uniref:hypothetical protein n=1 Tax=Meiothermus sp. QL-1 TaxID=2058095 RepID=UPI000E0B7922|nr:hypothetical protein [Meiothermus sp. QL-1]RDI96607.1 hypothetical protein DV704_02005 [Meiothermus sp. QL-1]